MIPVKASLNGQQFEAVQIFYSELNGVEELKMLKNFLNGQESNVEKVIRGTENLLFVNDANEGMTKVYEQDYLIKDTDGDLFVLGVNDFIQSGLKLI